jgi:hypothetical protein
MCWKARALVLAFVFTACGGGPEGTDGPPADAGVPQPALLLDPAQVATGDRLGDLEVRALRAEPSEAEPGGWVGTARLVGEVTVSGAYGEHPAHPQLEVLCFFPDEVSALRLPRFPNDQRHSWFCFDNGEQAFVALQRPPGRGTATVVIDELRYVYSYSVAHNSARLVRVVDHSPSPAPPPVPIRPDGEGN